ncbi:MAG: hypothetical protein JRN20_03330 [Nitrososphaerota archaeon]|nr:hypothetical protein [Nitrososphaerota archaeon]
MRNKRYTLLTLVSIALVATFVLAPILYYKTYFLPSGEVVSYYRSPSCLFFRFGGVYFSAHGHFGIEQHYYFDLNCPSLSTP